MISDKIKNGLNGNPTIPGDKSISHRSIIIPSISNGICEVNHCLESEDVTHTIKAFTAMGVKIEKQKNKIIIYGKGLNSLRKPKGDLYLGNSGTGARLLTGLLSSQEFETTLIGDKSLSSRPMNRIVNPLKKMNANIETRGGRMPLLIKGKKLSGADIEIDIPSAQIKSGILLAALNTNGITNVIENNITRDHTEIMLKAFDADITVEIDGYKKLIKIKGKKELKSQTINVPSDLSSSSFFIVAALINENSHIIIENVNINPTRNGILIALQKMGAKISLLNKRILNNEEVCDIEVFSSKLKGCDIGSNLAALMIDEYPILSVAASFADSPSIFRGLSELRVKESDRLELINLNLKKCGVNCEIINDDLYIYPSLNYKVNNNFIRTDFDHRIAMAFSVMGSKIGKISIDDSDSIKTSFPTFVDEFNKIGGLIS